MLIRNSIFGPFKTVKYIVQLFLELDEFVRFVYKIYLTVMSIFFNEFLDSSHIYLLKKFYISKRNNCTYM